MKANRGEGIELVYCVENGRATEDKENYRPRDLGQNVSYKYNVTLSILCFNKHENIPFFNNLTIIN